MENKKEEESAPFNMAIATLKRINDILEDYSRISINIIDSYERVYLKITTARQFFLTASLLLSNSETKKKLQKCSNGLKLLLKTGWNTPKRKATYQLDNKADEIVDGFVQLVQEAMQKEKYFMPSKDDPKFSWREN